MHAWMTLGLFGQFYQNGLAGGLVNVLDDLEFPFTCNCVILYAEILKNKLGTFKCMQ